MHDVRYTGTVPQRLRVEDPRGRGAGKQRAAAEGREGATPQKLAGPHRAAAHGKVATSTFVPPSSSELDLSYHIRLMLLTSPEHTARRSRIS